MKLFKVIDVLEILRKINKMDILSQSESGWVSMGYSESVWDNPSQSVSVRVNLAQSVSILLNISQSKSVWASLNILDCI